MGLGGCCGTLPLLGQWCLETCHPAVPLSQWSAGGRLLPVAVPGVVWRHGECLMGEGNTRAFPNHGFYHKNPRVFSAVGFSPPRGKAVPSAVSGVCAGVGGLFLNQPRLHFPQYQLCVTTVTPGHWESQKHWGDLGSSAGVPPHQAGWRDGAQGWGRRCRVVTRGFLHI